MYRVVSLFLLTVLTGVTSVAAAGPATHFSVSVPTNALRGASIQFTVTALDASNAVATAYTGTVHFTSSDAAAVLPADSALSNGSGTFSATFNTFGSQTITATDTVTSSITGTSSTIFVQAGSATHFSVSAPSTVVAGTQILFVVRALDGFNNTATSYNGQVHFTSNDPQATLPNDTVIVSGVATLSATLRTAGNRTITATDVVNSTIRGTSNTIAVSPAPATHLDVAAPATASQHAAFTFTVTALDDFQNIVTGFRDVIHFTSNDPAATLPSNSTLTDGIGTFTATLATPGSRTIIATDIVNNAIAGNASIKVGGPPRGILPIIGSGPGANGSFFHTQVELFNPSNSPASGTLIFRSIGSTDASKNITIPYAIGAKSTISLDPQLQNLGFGTLDIINSTGPLPFALVHVFDNFGGGTTGFSMSDLSASDQLTAGSEAVLLAPADLTTSRMNIGVRTLDDGAALTFTVRDKDGQTTKTTTRSYPPNFLTQGAAADVLGVALSGGESITIDVLSGGAIVYGAITDNVTQDPSIQFAHP